MRMLRWAPEPHVVASRRHPGSNRAQGFDDGDETPRSSRCIREVKNEAYDVEADVRTQWGSCREGIGGPCKGSRRARHYNINTLWECGNEDLRGDSASVHREGGVPILYGLLWEEVWESMF
jgi:hypothetical protein